MVFIEGSHFLFKHDEKCVRVVLYGGAGEAVARLNEGDMTRLTTEVNHEYFRIKRPLTPEEITDCLYRLGLY